MNTNKIYKTLAFAYSAAEKAGATRFDPTCYEAKVAEILTSTYKFPIKRTLAKWNLTKLDNTLYTLECTNKPDGTATFKWVAIGTFDSDGLLYGMYASEQVEAPKSKPQSGKGKAQTTVLTKAQKKAIRSECYKLAKGNRDEYDRLCKERGVDNGR